jgi:hypothetical protein
MPVSTIPLASAVSGTLPDGSAPSGSVIQVVQATTGVSTTINTTSETAVTGMSASITPSSTASRILVLINVGEFRVPVGDGARFQLYRNGSKAIDMINEISYSSTLSASTNIGMAFSYSYVDSPNTTSSTTYALFGRKLLNGQPVALQIMPNAASVSSVILMEIAG